MKTTAELTEAFNQYLASLEYIKNPRGLYDPIDYTLQLGGKRIRPILMLHAAQLFTEELSSLFPAAAGIETYHNFTLLHDDLMDKSDRRRGQLTVHRKWGENMAILSGDAMLILSYQFFTKTVSPALPQMLVAFNKVALEVCEGQQYDMEFEQLEHVTEEEYLNMIKLKTSVLLAASLEIGALYAEASKEDTEALYNFGLYTGLAFQLRDDYLDVYGDPKTFGKDIGGDILCNKKTWMLIKALEKADEKESLQLRGWLHRQDFLAEEKIDAVTEIYNLVGIPQLAEEKIEEYSLLALECLEKVSVASDRKESLRALALKMLNREK